MTPAMLPKKIIVRLRKHHGGSYKGELVGFTEEEANRLIEKKIAEPVEGANPVAVPKGIGPAGATTAPVKVEEKKPEEKKPEEKKPA